MGAWKSYRDYFRSDTSSFRVSLGTHFKNARDAFWHRFLRTAQKCRGGNVPIPPSFNWTQTFHAFIGCFLTFMILTYLNTALTNSNKGNAVQLVLGPFGALTTLL